MADVRAGVGQPTVPSGDAGIVTLWVRAESEARALEQGDVVLASRGYSEIGPLRSYLEEMNDDPLGSDTPSERAAERREYPVVAAYDAIKRHALAQADGLYELWLGRPADSSGDGT